MRRVPTRILVASVFAACLAGCAAQQGVVAVGPDRFALTRQQVATFPGRITLQADLFTEALRHCAREGKALNIVGAMERPARHIVDSYRWMRIEFECLPGSRLPPPRSPVRPGRNVAALSIA